MPSFDLHVGPFAAVFVGTATGSDVLTQLTSLTTQVQKVTFDQPETFNYAAGNSLQSGPVSITATLTFLSDDDAIYELAMGNMPDQPYPDTPSTYQTFTLLLQHFDDFANSSILIPTCYVKKTASTNYEKTGATVIPITFYWQQINRFSPQVFYKRTIEDLYVILGTRAPI